MSLLFEDPEAALNRHKWTSKVRTIQNGPWSFEDREYLEDMYQDESPVIVIKKARQLEITEYLVNLMLYYATERPNTTIIYASPRADQVSRISKVRVKQRAIMTSDYLRNQIDLRDATVGMMQFLNGSVVYFISAWGEGDAARNIDADVVIVDEVQDVEQAAIEAMREGMSHSQLQRLYLVGSPKLAGSEFDMAFWRFSDQKSWDVETKTWTPNPPQDREARYSGYHMFQAMAPWITQEEIEEKRETYSEQKFVNEVLGEFYTGGAVKLTIDQIMACTDRSLDFDMSSYQAPEVHYAGIDWGDRNWMIIMDKAGTIKRVIWWDDRADLVPVHEAIKQYNIRYLVADMGFGKSEVGRLQNDYGYKIWGCQYVAQQNVTFKKGAYHLPDGGEDMTKPVINANRTDAMDIVYERIYNKGYQFPYARSARERMETMFGHLLAPFEEFVEAGDGGLVMKKRYARSGPDHTFHALVYATIASMMGGSGIFRHDKELEKEEARWNQKEYWPQEREMDSWYDAIHSADTFDAF